MLDLARELLPLLREGAAVAAVTVAGVPRSAPRGVGATMAVTAGAQIVGSISGGCVEGDALMLALSVLRDGAARTARLGFGDEDAYAAGLACGGALDVVAYPVHVDDPDVCDALDAAAADRAVTVGLVTAGPEAGRVLPLHALRRAVAPSSPKPSGVEAPGASVAAALDDAERLRESFMLESAYGGAGVLVMSHAPRPRLILAGAGEHAAALCRIAAATGYAVTVCDPWETLATPERFPDADRVIVELPDAHLAELDVTQLDARTAVCVLTHDPRLDVPALRRALALPVGFVGAMGARATVERREASLRQAGVSEVDLARIHSPLGLDLGGASPEETAIAVLAEIVAARHGGTARPLRETSGPIHRRDGGSAGRGSAFPDAAPPASLFCAAPIGSTPIGSTPLGAAS